MVILTEQQKLVKILYKRQTGQCYVSIPRVFWDSVTQTGYLMASLQDGRLIYTTAPAPEKVNKGSRVPKYLQGNNSLEPTISPQIVSTRNVTIQEQAKKNLDPRINLEEEPDVWEDESPSQ
jgi:hypothetical protein